MLQNSRSLYFLESNIIILLEGDEVGRQARIQLLAKGVVVVNYELSYEQRCVLVN